VYYSDISGFDQTHIYVRGGATRPGSAGTIYFKDSTETYGRVEIDNENYGSSKYTPLFTNLDTISALDLYSTARAEQHGTTQPFLRVLTTTTIRSGTVFWVNGGADFRCNDLLIRSGGQTTFDSLYFHDQGLVTVESGGVLSAESLFVSAGAQCLGGGTINGFIQNAGVFSPGASAGEMTVNGDFVQTASGTIEIEIGGTVPTTDYAVLDVNGEATLNGTLSVSYFNLFEPIVGDSFQVIDYNSHVGTFSDFQGLDTTLIGVNYRDSGVVLLADSSDIVSTQTHIILSPAGNIPFVVNLSDQSGQPVAGSNDVWLDFTECNGVVGCPSEAAWPIVPATGVSGLDGNIRFWVNAGGCTQDSVKVVTSHGMIAKVAIRSLDPNGSLSINSQDFNGTFCSDYNLDGIVDGADWAVFSNHLGQNCLEGPSNYLRVTLTTAPGSGYIYSGDTLSIIASFTSSSSEDMVIDSVVFLNAGFGIASTWNQIGTASAFPLFALDTAIASFPFTVPASGHGCFQIRAFPRFSLSKSSVRSVSSDTLLYGFSMEMGETWAWLKSSEGQILNEVRVDSVTGEQDYSTLRLMGLTKEQYSTLASYEASGLIQLLSSPVADMAANRWETGFTEYLGTKQDTVLRRLSATLVILRDMFRLNSDSQAVLKYSHSEPCDCDPSPNGCGPEGVLNVLVPDFTDCHTQCCNTHDIAYCAGGGGTETDRLIADSRLAACMMGCDMLGLYLGPIYGAAVGGLGDGFYCYDEPPPPAPSAGRQLNTDARPRPGGDSDGDGIPDANDPCPQTAPGCRAMAHVFGGCAPGSSFGCPHGDDPGEHDAVPFRDQDDGDIYPFFIPLGDAFGDSLLITMFEFFPAGWSVELEDSSSFYAVPDTIFGIISHPEIINCYDTGRVIFVAYGMDGEYAGTADASVFIVRDRGDLDGNELIDISDVTMLIDHLFINLVPLNPLYAAELTHDNQVDIADLTRLIDYLYVSLSPITCDPPAAKTNQTSSVSVAVNATVDSLYTTVSVDASASLRGLELTLVGTDLAKPMKLVNDSLDMIFGQVESVVRIGIFDKNGPNTIKAGKTEAVRIPGKFRLESARAADIAFNSILADINSTTEPTLPKEFSLSQNFPNPFNPKTVIYFSLPKASNVELVIYNVLGQEVKTLTNRNHPPGDYEIEWDSRNDAGNEVASGVYLYRIVAGDYLATKKMLLLK